MKIGANIKINLLRREGKIGSLVLDKKGELTYLEHLIGRLKQIYRLEVFLTATPNDDIDELKKIAQKEKLPLFFDSENDRHHRLLNAIEEFKLDAMLDVPAIFTAIGSHHTQKMVEKHLQSQADITIPVNFPNGAVPLSILTPLALEKIVAAEYNQAYYKDFDCLPEGLVVKEFPLEGRRTFFETRLTLFAIPDIPRINKILEADSTTCQGEKRLYDELNIQDKYALFFKPIYDYLIEPTNHCNLRCLDCGHGLNTLTRERGFMPLGDFKKIVQRLPQNARIHLYGSGESFIHKDIYQMIDACEERFVEITANGHYFHSEKNKLNLLNSKLDRLAISIDGASEETYVKYRKRGKFSRVIKDLKELVTLRNSWGVRKPRIEMQFVVFRFNEHEIEDAKKLAEDLGVDKIYFKSARGRYNTKTFLRQRKDRWLQFVAGVKTAPFKTCLYPMVLWTGEYSPCSVATDGNLRSIGNLVTQSLEEIKDTEAYKKFAYRRASLNDDVCDRLDCYCYS